MTVNKSRLSYVWGKEFDPVLFNDKNPDSKDTIFIFIHFGIRLDTNEKIRAIVFIVWERKLGILNALASLKCEFNWPFLLSPKAS